jgi:hypothetical protein
MKVALVALVIIICVLGFLIFLWYVSKQDTKKPIEEIKEKDKNEVDFIKKIQAQYQGHKEEAKREEPLKPENRGALFMRAIERKQRGYKDDDDEYEHRLEELKATKKENIEQNTQEEVSPQENVNLSKDDKTSSETNLADDKVQEQKQQTTLSLSTSQIDGRVNRNEVIESQNNFEKRKAQVEMREIEKKQSIQKLREEILLEVENLKKRRLALITSTN